MGYMATWSDQKLSRHKQAQSYLSAGGAALGTTALAAAGMKAKPVGALAGKLAGKIEAPALAGGMKANGKTISGVSQARRLRAANVVRNTPGTIGSKAGGLTTASAGVGGVGGFNFAAIQGQEAKRSKMGSGRTGGGSLAPRGSVSKREYTANQKRIMARAYTKDEFKRSLKHDVAGNAAGLAAGAGVLASTKGGRTTLTGPAKLASAVYRGEKAAAKANRAASSRAGLGSSSKNVFGRVKGAASRAKDSFKDTKRAAGRATTAGLVGLNYSVQRSPLIHAGSSLAATGVVGASAVASDHKIRTDRLKRKSPVSKREPKYAPGTQKAMARRANQYTYGGMAAGAAAGVGGVLATKGRVGDLVNAARQGKMAFKETSRQAASRGIKHAGWAPRRAPATKPSVKESARMKAQDLGRAAQTKASNARNAASNFANSARAGANTARRSLEPDAPPGMSFNRAIPITDRYTLPAVKWGATGALGGMVTGATAAGIKNNKDLKARRANRNRSRVKKDFSTGIDFGTAGSAEGVNLEMVSKAYDPERKRGRRMENYRDAANVLGGAAIGASALTAARTGQKAKRIMDSGKDGLTPKKLNRLKPLGKPATAAAAGAALGAGALVTGSRIDSYRKGNGRPYRPLRG